MTRYQHLYPKTAFRQNQWTFFLAWVSVCWLSLALNGSAQVMNGSQPATGYPGNFRAIPRVAVAPSNFGPGLAGANLGTGGLRYVTRPTPAWYNSRVARRFFAGGGLGLGGYSANSTAFAPGGRYGVVRSTPLFNKR